VFYLDVAYVLYICCSGYTHIIQVYVLNISAISNICCSKCFMFSSVYCWMRHRVLRHASVGWARGFPCVGAIRSRLSGPRVRTETMCGKRSGHRRSQGSRMKQSRRDGSHVCVIRSRHGHSDVGVRPVVQS
jgi:hypothetical protein